MGVNLAANGCSLEEIGALFAGTKIHLCEFGSQTFEFCPTSLNFVATYLSFGNADF